MKALAVVLVVAPLCGGLRVHAPHGRPRLSLQRQSHKLRAAASRRVSHPVGTLRMLRSGSSDPTDDSWGPGSQFPIEQPSTRAADDYIDALKRRGDNADAAPVDEAERERAIQAALERQRRMLESGAGKNLAQQELSDAAQASGGSRFAQLLNRAKTRAAPRSWDDPPLPPPPPSQFQQPPPQRYQQQPPPQRYQEHPPPPQRYQGQPPPPQGYQEQPSPQRYQDVSQASLHSSGGDGDGGGGTDDTTFRRGLPPLAERTEPTEQYDAARAAAFRQDDGGGGGVRFREMMMRSEGGPSRRPPRPEDDFDGTGGPRPPGAGGGPGGGGPGGGPKRMTRAEKD
ncbi:unnamed protein product, partial [Phaeothamnion confervicola]